MIENEIKILHSGYFAQASYFGRRQQSRARSGKSMWCPISPQFGQYTFDFDVLRIKIKQSKPGKNIHIYHQLKNTE